MIRYSAIFISLASLLWANSLFNFKKEDLSLYSGDAKNVVVIENWDIPKTIPYPKDNPLTKEKVALGKKLFFDPRLSRNNDISCSSCHNPKYGWSDAREKAIGDQNKTGRRNSPTIINSAYLNLFFHDGRASSLEEQALGPIESEVEMNIKIDQLVKKLKGIKEYQELFNKAFDDGITKENIAKALASFQRTVISKNTPFDRWIAGDKNAISEVAKEGFDIFLNKGRCHLCHSGFNFTNETFANIGLGDEEDLGLYEISKNKNIIWYGAFKTPTLREVEKTAPYFHNGSVKTLKEAVTICGNGGKKPVKIRSTFFRDRKLSEDEVDKVVEFLKTLSLESIKY